MAVLLDRHAAFIKPEFDPSRLGFFPEHVESKPNDDCD
jgi:hypothetical protein